jgi:hypothetical protein
MSSDPDPCTQRGALYEFAGDWSVPKERLPRFWPGWIERPKTHAAVRTGARLSGDLADRARRYLASIPRPEIRSGTDAATLYAACRLVRGFGLSEGTAAELLWEWAGNRPGWTFEWVQLKARNAALYGTEPVGALK